MNFEDLNADGGFVSLDYMRLRERYGRAKEPEREDGEKKEADFLLACRLAGESPRPSMEAGFHAFLDKYVLHTHSVYANVLTCAKGGEELAKKVCAEISSPHAFLEYFHPGAELAIAIGRLAANNGGAPKIIFLKNHGIIISAPSAVEVLDLYEEVNGKIKKNLGLEKFLPVSAGKAEARFGGVGFSDGILFPDQAVFSGGQALGSSATELFNAWSYILSSINRLGLKPEFLSGEKVSYLRAMEAEKHRKAIHA